MPELRFEIRWPDGRTEACYSPSTVIRAHLAAGEVLPLAAFLARCEAGLAAASRRVEERYGQPCARAAAQLAALRAAAATQPPGDVQILKMG
jgi:uncharacterized repeat protein (TIGR04042 family)